MTEYTIEAKETVSGVFYIRANSEEEALKTFNDYVLDGGYRDMMETVEDYEAKVVEHRVIDGTEIEAAYVPEMDMTIIVRYTYKNAEPVMEEIVGFYHGTPNDGDTKYYADKGTVSILI